MEDQTHIDMTETIGEGCYIRLRGKMWHAVFTDSDRAPRQKSKTLRTGNKAKASAKAYEMMRQWELGRYDPWNHADSNATLQEALKHYLREKPGNESRRHCARLLERIFEYGSITSTAALTPERISQFIYQPGLSDSSRWSYHNKIGAAVNWLFRKGYWLENPMADVPKPPEPKTIPRHYDEDDIERFLQYAENYYEKNKEYIHVQQDFPLWFVPCFELIAFTGLRPAEAMRLNWGDIIWPEQTEEKIGQVLVMGPTKTKVERTITMHPRAERVLRWMQANHRISNDDAEPVLKNHTGRERISKAYLGVKFTRIQKYAQMKDIGLYGLRHTYAAYLRRRGLPLHIIQDEFGHKDLRTTEKYGKLGTSERMRATFSRF